MREDATATNKVQSASATLPAIPVIDVGNGGPLRHATHCRARARALCDDCLTFLPRAVAPFVPALDRATRHWLTRSCSPYVSEIAQIAATLGIPGIWLAQRLVPMGLHVARTRRRRCPLARPPARLAIPRAWAPCGCRPHPGACRRILRRHLAWLRWRADSDGAMSVRRLPKPGANVAPQPASVAALL